MRVCTQRPRKQGLFHVILSNKNGEINYKTITHASLFMHDVTLFPLHLKKLNVSTIIEKWA